MGLLHSSEDVVTAPSEKGPSPLVRAVRLAFGEGERLREEREHLAAENRRLTSELARLNEENASLREAATIWIRLYEKQLERANRSAEQPARRMDFRAR